MTTIKEKGKIVAVDMSKGDCKNRIAGIALTNSVDEDDWNYIYNTGYEDCKSEVLGWINKYPCRDMQELRGHLKNEKS